MIGSTFSTPEYNEFYKTGDLGIFERVIDNLILDKYSDDDELKDFIKNLPTEDKRMSTLSLMSDDNVLWSKIYGIHSGNDTKYNKVKKIILLLRDYVKIADVERKSHGEILTPFEELAKPMVNLMDKYDKDFWTVPTNKVLDSSAGYGTFLILCLYKFMEGLVEFEPDEDKRLKHIIENQLYYGELQAKSVFSWLVAIDPNDEYNTNIYWGSYLDDGFDYHMKNVWKVEKFDLIIQNPPYQMQKEGFKKTQPLWHLFVQKSLNFLNNDSYMIMVHPGSWRNVDGMFQETKVKMTSKQILYLNMNSTKVGFDIFGANIDFDYYLLKNTNSKIDTDIVDMNNNIYSVSLKNIDFIPNSNISEVLNLVAKPGEEKIFLIWDSKHHTQRLDRMSKIKDDTFKYPCLYTVGKKNPGFWYSKDKSTHFDLPKVIWGNGLTDVITDSSGKYGLTQFAYAIVDEINNLENIQKALKSERFIKEIMGYNKGVGHIYNRKIIATFRKDFWKEFIN